MLHANLVTCYLLTNRVVYCAVTPQLLVAQNLKLMFQTVFVVERQSQVVLLLTEEELDSKYIKLFKVLRLLRR